MIKNEFIIKSKLVHGDKYDYSQVVYVNNKTKVKIVCFKHGVFKQKPADHLQNHGCKICGYNDSRKSLLLTTEDFIERSKLIHDDLYDYSLVDYKGMHIKIKIICPIHGVFEQRPDDHLHNHKCALCSERKSSTNEFIKKAQKVHGNKYDYSLVNYKNAGTKVKIICPVHGVFEQRPYNHLSNGCKMCSGNFLNTTDEFIKKAQKVHGNKYDYTLVDYKNTDTKVKIICPKHGIFEIKPYSHLRCGCLECSGKKKLTTYQFIKKSNEIHNNKYDYSLVNYVNIKTKVKIICPVHGVFEQIPFSHLFGQGCPNCVESRGENIIRGYLNKNDIKFDYQKRFEHCKNKNTLPFDFYLQEYNVCIEYNGEQHYELIEHFGKNSLKRIQQNDNIKKLFCENNNINLFIIKYDENIIEKLDDFLEKRI